MVKMFLIRGGILMYPLIILSVISLAVIIEKIFLLKKMALSGKIFSLIVSFPEITVADTNKKPNQAIALINQVIKGYFARQEDYRIIIDRINLTNLNRIDLLDLTGRIAPMIGLTGTVIGLAKSFQTVSYSGRTGDTALLAGGIWEAMITTITGLLIAIPAIIAAHILRNSFRKHTERLKHCCDTVYYHMQADKNE